MPRFVIVEADARVLLLDSSFDAVLDDFAPDYTVYQLPATVLESLGDDWTNLSLGGRLLGTIRVSEVRFDDSRRKAVSESSIHRFLIE